MARKALINKIKKDANYTFFDNAFEQIASTVDTTFFDFSWKVPSGIDNDPLFRLGKDNRYTTMDFLDYARQQKRERIQLQGRKSVNKALRTVFVDFVDKRCIEYEEDRLEEKYPDFKALMREYEEGILLFEITRVEVWDKASEDTVGLEQYYMNNRENYKWPERMKVEVVYIDSTSRDEAVEIYDLAGKKGLEKVSRKYNKDREIVSIVEEKWDKDKNELSDVVLAEGRMGPLVYDEDTRDSRFFKLGQKLPVEYKSLEEARGYIIADYQDHLEEEWIAQLEEKYPVEINQEVFESLVRE
jgi:peptidyl-prolyl cis-trans isomerase SurA